MADCRPARTHGHAVSDLSRRSGAYKSWQAMLKRARGTSKVDASLYAHVTVCERWTRFENFYEDMGDRPEGMSLDRIDPRGNYEPSNCRWADWKTQRANQVRNDMTVECDGITDTITGWASRNGLTYAAIWQRMKHGVSPQEAVTRPLRNNGLKGKGRKL
jgi:hypothetical protein